MYLKLEGGSAVLTTERGESVTLSTDDLGALATFARRQMAESTSLERSGAKPVPTLYLSQIGARTDIHQSVVLLTVQYSDGARESFPLPPSTASNLVTQMNDALAKIAEAGKNRDVQ